MEEPLKCAITLFDILLLIRDDAGLYISSTILSGMDWKVNAWDNLIHGWRKNEGIPSYIWSLMLARAQGENDRAGR